MYCDEAQEHILEALIDALIDPRAAEQRLAMENHVATCSACSSFAEMQRGLDARLADAVPPAHLSPGFRATLKRKLRRDPLAAWPDFLPDVAHLAGCTVAIAVAVLVLPIRPETVLLAGVAFTGATYVLQSALRMSLEEFE